MKYPRNYFRYPLYLALVVGYLHAFAGSYEDFFIAIKRDHRNTVEALLERGFDPNTLDETGQPGVVIALQNESFAVADALVDSARLDIEAASPAGETALMMASLRGQTSMVERLLARGAQVNRPGWSPLHYAAIGTDDHILRLLLKQGATIDARSPNGTTPLMMAAQYGPWSCVDALLSAGADIALTNDLGLSVIDFAIRGGRDGMAASLERRKGRSR